MKVIHDILNGIYLYLNFIHYPSFNASLLFGIHKTKGYSVSHVPWFFAIMMHLGAIRLCRLWHDLQKTLHGLNQGKEFKQTNPIQVLKYNLRLFSSKIISLVHAKIWYFNRYLLYLFLWLLVYTSKFCKVFIRVSHVEQAIPTFPEYLISWPSFGVIRVVFSVWCHMYYCFNWIVYDCTCYLKCYVWYRPAVETEAGISCPDFVHCYATFVTFVFVLRYNIWP